MDRGLHVPNSFPIIKLRRFGRSSRKSKGAVTCINMVLYEQSIRHCVSKILSTALAPEHCHESTELLTVSYDDHMFTARCSLFKDKRKALSTLGYVSRMFSFDSFKEALVNPGQCTSHVLP